MAKRHQKSVRLTVRLNKANADTIKQAAHTLGWDESRTLRWLLDMWQLLIGGSVKVPEVRTIMAEADKARKQRAKVEHADAAVRVAQRAAAKLAAPESKAPEVVE